MSFLCHLCKTKKEEHARVGISVGKKLGKAVQRNKIKRQVRMMVQEIYDFSENFDTIILVRVKYKEESYLNNKKLLGKMVKKLKYKVGNLMRRIQMKKFFKR